VDIAGHREIALVDVAIVAERYVGARALWRAQNFKELFVTFAETEVIGMPVDRDTPEGRHVHFDNSNQPAWRLQAPIAPGVIETIGIESWGRLLPDQPIAVGAHSGSIAFDGERELSFTEGDHPTVTLRTNAFRTINVAACMNIGAISTATGLQHQPPQNHNWRNQYERQCLSTG
jgi:hypothetical protein